MMRPQQIILIVEWRDSLLSLTTSFESGATTVQNLLNYMIFIVLLFFYLITKPMFCKSAKIAWGFGVLGF